MKGGNIGSAVCMCRSMQTQFKIEELLAKHIKQCTSGLCGNVALRKQGGPIEVHVTRREWTLPLCGRKNKQSSHVGPRKNPIAAPD